MSGIFLNSVYSTCLLVEIFPQSFQSVREYGRTEYGALGNAGLGHRPGLARRFLPDDAFNPVAHRRLSDSLGTAVFFAPEDGSFSSGAWRLDARYARTPDQSECGETDDEVVSIRFTI